MEHLSKTTQFNQLDADVEIINDLKALGIHKRKAEVRLFEKFFYLIRCSENKYSLSREDLYDAYTDTVLAVIKSITFGEFENRSTLKTFVYEVFQNKCIDRLRKRSTFKNTVHKTQSLGAMQASLSDTSLTVIERLVKQSDMEYLWQQMIFLPENCRKALLLSLKGYSDKEIAAMVNFKTADVAKTIRLRSIKKLRQLVS